MIDEGSFEEELRQRSIELQARSLSQQDGQPADISGGGGLGPVKPDADAVA